MNRVSLSDAEVIGALAVAGAVIYFVYRAANAASDAANNAIDMGNNFDANLGLSNFDSWVSGLFNPPSTGNGQ